MMTENLVLESILTDINLDTRLEWKTSGLFSKNETGKEVKDEVLKDFQRNLDDCLATDLNYSLLLPMPYADAIPQHIQTNTKLDIPEPSVLDEAVWDLGSFDVENNIHCEIFSELSDLVTPVSTDEVAKLKPEVPPAFVSKPGTLVAASCENSVSQSSVKPAAPRDFADHFFDHNYAAVVPKSPVTYEAIEDTRAATCGKDPGQSEMSKTMKYFERRKKNNLASRRSRETRKRKYAEMEEQVFRLEQKNAELRNRIAKMEWLTCTMKRSLFGKIDVPHSFPN